MIKKNKYIYICISNNKLGKKTLNNIIKCYLT